MVGPALNVPSQLLLLLETQFLPIPLHVTLQLPLRPRPSLLLLLLPRLPVPFPLLQLLLLPHLPLMAPMGCVPPSPKVLMLLQVWVHNPPPVECIC